MTKDSWKNLSQEAKNRIYVWHIMIEKAHAYLVINDKVEISDKSTYLYYEVASKTRKIMKESHIKTALEESAVIWLCNILTTGDSGEGIANNYDTEIENFRNKMLDYVFLKLRWNDRDKFDAFIKKIKQNRNRLIAHYDGKYADYKQPQECITTMKLPGVSLDYYEKNDLKNIIKYIDEFLYSAESSFTY